MVVLSLIVGTAAVCAVMGFNLGGWAGALMIGVAVVCGGPFALVLLGFGWTTVVRVEPPGCVVVSRGFLTLRKPTLIVDGTIALEAEPAGLETERWQIVARTADGRAVSVVTGVSESEARDAVLRLQPEIAP